MSKVYKKNSASNPNPKFKKLYYCATCGKMVFRYDSQATGKNVFCSRSCSAKYNMEDKLPKRDITRYFCKECGKEIDCKTKGYCWDCHYKLGLHSGENHERWIERVIVKCDWCGEDISRRPSDLSPHNFCNQECMGLWFNENSPYKKIISVIRGCTRSVKWRKKVLERDEFKCRGCRVDGYLEAHHKIELYKLVKMYRIENLKDAYDCKALWDIDNGESLCLDCHGDAHERYFHRFREREVA